MYRNLWNVKIKDAQLGLDISPDQLESVLYKIANEIYDRQENLCVPKSLFDPHYKELNYLISENLVINQNNDIQFFHQSFYDYTYSRNFVDRTGGNIYDFLDEQNHQGLFIRAITKQVLTYLRPVNPKQYIKELNKILFSEKIRYHLKLLVVEQLAFEEKPKLEEFKIVLSLWKHSLTLIYSFFNSNPGIGWFKMFSKRQNHLLTMYSEGDETLKNVISRFIVFSADSNIETAYNILLQIENGEAKFNLIKWTLFRAKDYSNSVLTEAYFSVEKDNLNSDGERLHILGNAIKSNPEFAISESRKVLSQILNDWKKKRKRELGHDSEESLFLDFCEELYQDVPSKAYPFITEIIESLTNKTKYDRSYFGLKVLTEDAAFEKYQPETYTHHKLIDWVIDYLKKTTDKNTNLAQKELDTFLKSNSATLYYIALQILHYQPEMFRNQIFSLLTNQDLIEDFFQIKDLQYYFRELINKSYLLLSTAEQGVIDSFILSYYPRRDFNFNSEYKNERKKYGTVNNLFYPYRFWGHDQWILLNSLPNDAIKNNYLLRKQLNMFSRRFSGWNYKNEKPNHSVVMASIVGGLMPLEKYKKLSIKHWHNSFIKLKDQNFYNSHRNNYSVEEHARSFKSIVQKDPEKYYSFIKDLISENKVHIRYQINGIEGLINGEYEIQKVRGLYQFLMIRKIPAMYLFAFIKASKYFIIHSFADKELLDYWKTQLESPLIKTDVEYSIDNQEDRKNALFKEGWNSPNSWAAEMIIHLSDDELYTNDIYDYLLNICDALPIQLRLVILYHLNNKYVFNHDDLLKLFIAYTNEFSEEFYFVASQIISDLFYRHFDNLVPFVKESMNFQKTAEPLGAYLLYGWFYGHELSKELLFKLHILQPDSIKMSIERACIYMSDQKYKEISLHILSQYANDKRKVVREGFSKGFYDLKPNDLPFLLEIISHFISDINEERLNSLYYYLERCASYYPYECIKILNAINFEKTMKNRYEIKELFKILILCYNAIREYEIEDKNLEFTMDVLDKLLQRMGDHAEIDEMLIELDVS